MDTIATVILDIEISKTGTGNKLKRVCDTSTKLTFYLYCVNKRSELLIASCQYIVL